MDLDGGPGMAVVSDEIGDGRWTPLAFTLCVVAGRLAPCGVDGMQTGRTEMASDVRDRRRQEEGEEIGGGGQGRADETEAAWPELQANAESQEERWMSRSRLSLAHGDEKSQRGLRKATDAESEGGCRCVGWDGTMKQWVGTATECLLYRTMCLAVGARASAFRRMQCRRVRSRG